MSEQQQKVDAEDEAIFDPAELPAEQESEESTGDDEERESKGEVRSINKKRIAIVACVFIGGLLVVAMLGIRGGGASEKSKKQGGKEVSGTSAEKEVERLENMQMAGKDGEKGVERPPDKRKELRKRKAKNSEIDRLKKKLEKKDVGTNASGGGPKKKGPWEKAQEQARRRHARAYHNEAFQARRSKVFATVETPSGRRESEETSGDGEKAGSVKSMRKKLARKRRKVKRRIGGGPKGRKPLPPSATEKKKFLEVDHVSTTTHVHRLRKPVSEYVVQAGTMLPLILETGINSELPGPLRGRFARPVYDSRTGRHLLIPAGAMVLGKYNSKVEEGQTRAQVVWTRLILPNGKSIKLGNIPGVDLQGKSGYSDKVDNHWGQVGAGVALTSLLSAGAGAAAGPQSSLSQSPEQGALSAAGKNVAKTGKGVVDRELEKKPVVKIRAGMRVGALVHEDLVLEPYTSRAGGQ